MSAVGADAIPVCLFWQVRGGVFLKKTFFMVFTALAALLVGLWWWLVLQPLPPTRLRKGPLGELRGGGLRPEHHRAVEVMERHAKPPVARKVAVERCHRRPRKRCGGDGCCFCTKHHAMANAPRIECAKRAQPDDDGGVDVYNCTRTLSANVDSRTISVCKPPRRRGRRHRMGCKPSKGRIHHTGCDATSRTARLPRPNKMHTRLTRQNKNNLRF